MPLLTLKWNIKSDHPVVDEFGSDNSLSGSALSTIIDRGSGHRTADVLVNRFNVLVGQASIDLGIDILRDGHAFYVIDRLLVGLVIPIQEWFVPF